MRREQGGVMTRCPHRALAAPVFALALASSTAFATAQRTFVASYGHDTDPCSVTLPCRSFATAAAQTNPFGEIIILDSAGYGTVTLTQSISIIAPPGVYGGISVPSGQSGIRVDNASAYVVLRGLTINGQGGNNGILVENAVRVRIEGCSISRMSADGIAINAGGSNPELSVTDSTISENAAIGIHASTGAALAVGRVRIEANGSHGIANEPAASMTLSIANSIVARNTAHGIELRALNSTTLNASVTESEMSGNGLHGIDVSSGGPATDVRVAVARSTLRGNGSRGLYVVATSPGIAYADLQGNNIVGNGASGAYADGSARMTLSGNSITSNNYGIYQDATSVVESIGNNLARHNNLGDVFGTVTSLPAI
jgi:hypothetical protein